MSVKIIDRKPDYFVGELTVEFEERKLSSITTWIKNFLKKRNLQENAISNISYKNIFNKDGKLEKTIVHIKYFRIDLCELRAKLKTEQIRFVLNEMGYEDSAIKEIQYRKFSANSDELIWVVSIIDKDFNYGPDESYAEREHRNLIWGRMHEVLDFRFELVISPW